MSPHLLIVIIAGLFLVGYILFAASVFDQIRAVPGLVVAVNELQRVACRDALTGLQLQQQLETIALPAAMRAWSHVSLIYLDLDGFKKLNDSKGHQAGDRLVYQAAQAIRGAVDRASDQVFRLYRGGDEFAVLLAGAGAKRAAELAIKVERQLQAIGVTAGIGVLSMDTLAAKARPSTVLHAADHLCREAKRIGKGIVVGGSGNGQTQRLFPPCLPSDDESAGFAEARNV